MYHITQVMSHDPWIWHICNMALSFENGGCMQEFSNGWVMSHMSHIHGSCLWHDSFIWRWWLHPGILIWLSHVTYVSYTWVMSVTWLMYMKVVAASRNSHMVESCHICFIYMGHVCNMTHSYDSCIWRWWLHTGILKWMSHVTYVSYTWVMSIFGPLWYSCVEKEDEMCDNIRKGAPYMCTKVLGSWSIRAC